MSIKVYPYLTKPDEITFQNTSSSDSETAVSSFQEIFAEANRSQQAIAVDMLIARSKTGSIDVETVQRLLGFNPAPNSPIANSKLTGDAVGASDASSSKTKDSSAASVSAADLEDYFAEAAAAYNVDINLLKAIARAESNFNPNASSQAGAMGVMQLMPSTASSLGIDNAYDAHDNIMGGAKVIAENLERYNGDISLALAAYNAGPGNVDKYGGIPPFEETQNYVKKVLEYYENA